MASNTGAVYVFKRTGATWALEQEISDKSSGFTSLLSGDLFGYSVALDGEIDWRLELTMTMVISGGNTGAIYVFKRTGTTWALEQEISDKSSGFTSLLLGDHFGYSVALDGDRLAIGSEGVTGIDNSHLGLTYVFGKTNTTWGLNQAISDAKTINNNSWQYFKTANSTAPDCNSSDDSKFNTAATTNQSITAVATDHDKWVCFKVKNSNGIASYVKHQIDLAPIVTVGQDSDSVDASRPLLWLPQPLLTLLGKISKQPTRLSRLAIRPVLLGQPRQLPTLFRFSHPITIGGFVLEFPTRTVFTAMLSIRLTMSHRLFLSIKIRQP